MNTTVTDNLAASRFELVLGEAVAFIDYQRDGAVLVLTHAEVPPALGGSGVGSRLTAAVLELVRRRGEQVVPRCSFVAAYIARHPQYQNLLAQPER
ncbi:MAG: GNAT family N-acetyltransferase [Pseudomonadota bacterium]|nr:GNAT family N-acetyltransferase [Pseudomonadota bacterium]